MVADHYRRLIGHRIVIRSTPTDSAATGEGDVSGHTVWLASYPKSGNTWLRAIVTALSTHSHLFGVNQLSSGAQPNHVGAALTAVGLDARWLDQDEVDQLRTALIHQPERSSAPAERSSSSHAEAAGSPRIEDAPAPRPPQLRKTHETYRHGLPGREPFPTEATRAAILIIRDPRDVACSYAAFFGVDLDQAVDAIGTDAAIGKASPARMETAQPWGSWSSHSASWLADDVPFEVHLVRYEDLAENAVETLLPVFAAIGLDCSRDELEQAVDRARFDRLQQAEEETGFREKSKATRTFFRKGAAGGWHQELSDEQVVAIEADHAEMMTALGYDLTGGAEERARVAEVRESRRRQRRHSWLRLPESMGIAVREGDVPEELPGAERPKPWIQVNSTQAVVRFGGGAALLVENGRDVTVHWEPEPGSPDDDPSWIVQGWAVTLAMLQRGDLSLHAATVRIGDEVVAIAGDRGAGKSTTSMALRKRGHQLLIDDVTLIEFRDGEAWTTPFSRNVHLLSDAAEALGVDFDALPMLAGGRRKVAFRAEDPPEEPQRIDRIVVLAPDPSAREVDVQEVHGSQRLSALLAHTRRDGIAPLVLGHERYFALMAQLSNAAPVFVLRRPSEGWTLDRVLDLIEQSRR